MTEKLGQDALAYAAGYLSFIHMVNPAQAENPPPRTRGWRDAKRF